MFAIIQLHFVGHIFESGVLMTLWILLPAYNEEASLESLLSQISDNLKDSPHGYRIVVVNDGSTDRTGEILKQVLDQHPMTVITHSFNRGLGETERDGFELIAVNCSDEDIIVRLDCDDTHGAENILPMVSKIGLGADVISASRFQPDGGQMGVPPSRALISRFANIFMKIMFNIHGLRDYTCGFRAYRGQVIRDAISIFGNNFFFNNISSTKCMKSEKGLPIPKSY